MAPKKTWMSWSTGKDSAYALFSLQKEPTVELTGFLTTVTCGRVSMHAVREELLKLQAEAIELPLRLIKIPPSCTNVVHEERMSAAISEAKTEGVEQVGFGDLFLEDVRSYREKKLQGSGITPLFPLWKRDTKKLAHEMIESGLKAILTCVDLRVLAPQFAGRQYDASLLAELPSNVDPCGENGEFHTFVYDAPFFKFPLPIEISDRVEQDGCVFADARIASTFLNRNNIEF